MLATKGGSNRLVAKGGCCDWDSASLKEKKLYKDVRGISDLGDRDGRRLGIKKIVHGDST